MSFEEKRRHPRIKAGLQVSADVGDERCHASILDIAEGGAFILVETKRQGIGTKVMIRFWVVKNMCEAGGQVIRTVRTRAGPAFGIKFDRQNEAFTTWVRALSTADEAERAHRLAHVDKPVVFFH